MLANGEDNLRSVSMTKSEKIVKSAMMLILAFSSADAVLAASKYSLPTKLEKCYGVVKAGLNDCATDIASCAASTKKDNQADAFLLLPEGICEKIVGGSLTIKQTESK